MAKHHKNKTKRNKHGKQTNKSAIRVAAKDGTTWSVVSQGKPASKLPRVVSNEPFRVIQTVDGGALLTTSGSAPTFGSIYFTAGGLDQISSFSAIFDQYRIDLVEAWITPQYNPANGAQVEYASVIDYDDANNLTTYAQATDYENCVESSIGVGHYRCFKPHIATAAYSGSFTSYGNLTSPWIDMASTTVQHYGIKIACQTISPTSTIHIVYRLHFSFRNVR